MNQQSSSILIIEDNKDLALGLRNNLEIEGYQVACAVDGEEGLRLLDLLSPALIILDLMMPRLDGYQVLKALQKKTHKPLILVLSARDTEIDKVRGLRLGADDFVTKPFGLMELLARVEALLRRKITTLASSDDLGENTIYLDNIRIELLARQVFKSDVEVILAPKEYDLLINLLSHRGEAISRLKLMQDVWGYSSAVETRTVDTHIGELRKKLESDTSHPTIIKTVRKVGYRIDW